MTAIIRQLLLALGLFVALQALATVGDRALFDLLHTGGDDTDGAGVRSGLGLRLDHGTGCQYLESRYGGLTPRLDNTGRHICKRGA